MAVEQTLLLLTERVHASVNTPDRQNNFREFTDGKPIRKKHSEVQQRLASPDADTVESRDVFGTATDGILIDPANSNDVGIPTGDCLIATRRTLYFSFFNVLWNCP